MRLAACTCLALLACKSTPGATEVGDGGEPPVDPAVLALAERPAAELPVEPLDAEGVRGGRIVYTLPGSPEAVYEMLFDFEGASGRRVWAREYRLVERTATGAIAHFVLEGRMGIHPQCDVEFVVETLPTTPRSYSIEFRLVAPAFGLAAFFGDHALTPVGKGDETLVTSRIYIDSGLPIVNATAKNIEDGLREDVEQMRIWMRERLGVAEYRAR
jgi:hypothetical protein